MRLCWMKGSSTGLSQTRLCVPCENSYYYYWTCACSCHCQLSVAVMIEFRTKSWFLMANRVLTTNWTAGFGFVTNPWLKTFPMCIFSLSCYAVTSQKCDDQFQWWQIGLWWWSGSKCWRLTDRIMYSDTLVVENFLQGHKVGQRDIYSFQYCHNYTTCIKYIQWVHCMYTFYDFLVQKVHSE